VSQQLKKNEILVQPTSSTQISPLLLGEWTKIKQKEIAQDVSSWGLISYNASNNASTGMEAKVSDDDSSEKASTRADKDCPVLILLEALLSFGCWDSFTQLLELCHYPPPPRYHLHLQPSIIYPRQRKISEYHWMLSMLSYSVPPLGRHYVNFFTIC
jgi:hypothetical protein